MTRKHLVRINWITVGATLSLAYVVAYILIMILTKAPPWLAALDWMSVPAPLAGGIVCGFVCVKTRRRSMRWFWGLMAAGLFSSALAEGTGVWYEEVLLREIPYPSWADVEWLAFYPLTFAALLIPAFSGVKRRLPGMTSALDALMFAAAGAALGWEFLMKPAMDPTAGLLANVVNLAYPVGDLLLLAGLVSLVLGVAEDKAPRGGGWLLIAFGTTFLADIAYAQMFAAGVYVWPSWVDPLWSFGYALPGVAAIASLSHERRPRVAASRIRAAETGFYVACVRLVRRWMPYSAALACAVLASYHFVFEDDRTRAGDAVVIGACTVIWALVLLRQSVVVWDNHRLQSSLARMYEEARYLADRDPVTGLLNHRSIGAEIEREVARSQRSGSCFALIMMDIDNFKLFNDTYGHMVGDEVLVLASTVIKKAVRPEDTVGRFGGDEFVGLMPNSDAPGAERVANRIKQSLATHSVTVRDGSAVPLCMSYGVAAYPFQGRQTSQLLAAADSNLYQSKRRGGDCVTVPDSDGHSREAAHNKGFTVLDALVNTVDSKDHYTRKHSDEMTKHALALAVKLGLSPETQGSLRTAGLLHDVGKIGIMDNVLRKPGPLTEEEYEAVKQHVSLGELIIKEIPDLDEVVGAVGGHHERYDGSGYPRGLKGEDIPFLARILAVTDAYSAMTTNRPYRKALTLEEARSELKKVSGTQLDPKVVAAFLAVLDDASYSEAKAEVASVSVAACRAPQAPVRNR
jgi:diguanylate cyclase (GGDEF)-like protein